MRFYHVGQGGLDLLASLSTHLGLPRRAGITGVSHHAWPKSSFLKRKVFINNVHSCFVTQAGVQWQDLGSLQPLPPGSSDSPSSGSQVSEITVETGFHHVGQAGLELLTSSHPPASASQSAEITGVCHLTQPGFHYILGENTIQPIIDSSDLDCQVAETTAMHHHSWLTFVFLVEIGSPCSPGWSQTSEL
ncbi:hypothetical protein AAY473_030517, partial [Plecturocebus cupreus]